MLSEEMTMTILMNARQRLSSRHGFFVTVMHMSPGEDRDECGHKQ